MKLCFIVFLMIIIVSLSAQFNDPIHINEELGEVFFRGNDACKVINNTVYLTFVEAETGNVYLVYSPNGEVFLNTVVYSGTLDKYTKLRKMLQPTIEVSVGGEISIFYIREVDYSTILYRAFSIDNGQTFSIEQIAEEVSSFSTCSEDNEILLSYHQGTLVPFTGYQYFTNFEKSENDDGTGYGLLKFWGPDFFEGSSHSNDDIWIQQAGGGSNNGWPTFNGIVTTSKRIINSSTPYPPFPENVFPNGYLENIQKIIYHPSADEIATNGTQIGVDAEIVYMKINGSNIDCMYGDIVEIGTEEFPVYSWFPHNAAQANAVVNNGGNWYEDAVHIWTNEITIYDTIWTVGQSLPVADQTYWIPNAELWIEGEVNGMLTIGCAENVSIVGDITYTNTIPGEAPDDPSNLNISDYFGLASEKRIIIKYKHKDPFNNMEIRDDNCDNVMLYGAFAAIGVADTLIYGNLACHYDGLFTPEYQHPHGSTPDFIALSPYTLQETLYTYVDLHKYVFPQSELPPELDGFNLHGGQPVVNQTCGFPYESPAYINSYPNNDPGNYVYPYGTDYPWYNPVWPESSEDIVFERGIITLFGSIAQTRRGFIHRSGSDPYNHPGDNEWGMDEFHYDGDHGSTGYDKDYNFDSRFMDVTLPYFPKTNPNGMSPHLVIQRSEDAGNSFNTIFDYSTEDYIVQSHDLNFEENLIMLISQARDGYNIFYSLDSGANFDNFEIIDIPTQKQFVESIKVSSGKGYFNTKLYNEEMVFEFDPVTQEISTFLEDNDNGYLSDFAVGNSGCKIYVSYNLLGNLDFNYTGDDINILSENITWQPPISILSPYLSNISINYNDQDSVFINIVNTGNNYNNTEGELYFYSGSLENLVEIQENEIIPPKVSMQIYPNPFNPETTISFSLTTVSTENTEINIYNVRGQKVKKIDVILSPESSRGKGGSNSVIWNGKDLNGKSVASGIYLFELKSDGKVQKTKKGLLLK